MTLILPQRRTQQPQYPVDADWSNPITRGLEFLWSATTPTIELIKGQNGTIVSGDTAPIRDLDKNGLAVRGGGGVARRRMTWSGAPYKSSVDYTVATFCMKESTAGNPFDADDVYGVRMFQLSYDNAQFIAFNTSVANFGAANPTPVDFKAQLYAGRVSAGQITSWIDGVSSSPVTITGTVQGCASNSIFSVGAFATNNGGTQYNSGFNGKIYICAYWARALYDAELKSLSANPWQLFRPAVS